MNGKRSRVIVDRFIYAHHILSRHDAGKETSCELTVWSDSYQYPWFSQCVVGDSSTVSHGGKYLKKWITWLESNADVKYAGLEWNAFRIQTCNAS